MNDNNHDDQQDEIEESDEDAWYARMERAALDNDNTSQTLTGDGQINVEEFLDDDMDYFEKLENQAKRSGDNDVFVEESSSVWQSMLRTIASDNQAANILTPFTIIRSSDDTSLILCRQWLFSFLPNALSIYHVVSSSYLASYPERVVFVDHTLHPSVVFTYMFKPTEKYLHTAIFSPFALSKSLLTKLSNLLFDIVIGIPTCKSLYLAYTDYALYDAIFVNDKRYTVKWTEVCKMFICDPSAKIELMRVSSTLPEGYCYCDLSEEDAQIINDTWKYRSQQSIHMVRKMVNNTIKCRGIKHCDDGLVAWCLTYEDGPLGMLQTIPSHRQKGLGRCVVANLLIRLLDDAGTESPPYCYIEQSNEASMSLFRSLGFYKTTDVVWSEFSIVGRSSDL